LKPSIEEHRGLGGPGGKGAVVSPEIETYTQHGMHLGDVVVARERWSRLRLKQQYQVAFLDTAYVARERWSRLRLKPARSSAFFDNFGGGKGAVVSPEIETLIYVGNTDLDIAVARERWSRLRLKHVEAKRMLRRVHRGKGAVVSPEIETTKLQRCCLSAYGGKGAVVSPEIETFYLLRE